MTNLEKIRGFSTEELADFIEDSGENWQILVDDEFCNNICSKRANGSCPVETEDKHCDCLPVDILVAWLKANAN